MWKDLEEKLNKSGRKWSESTNSLSYRYANLYCESCGCLIGLFDIVSTNLETNMYCEKCVKKFKRNVPYEILYGTIVFDNGASVDLKYKDSYYKSLTVSKICYFSKKGRYIKVKGKRVYL